MGTNTLNTAYVNGEIIDAAHVNSLTQAIISQLVGRNSSGVPASGQSLGTVALPWGTLYANNIVLNGSAIDVSQIVSPANMIVSGQTRTTSNQPAFIKPAGSSASFTIEAATTNLVLQINGSAYTLTSDKVKSSLTTAPSSNNTCLVNDTNAADQESTRTWGEYNSEYEYITVDTMGSEITSLVGKIAAFKINDGVNDEYFLAYVESTTKLSRIYRGYFQNSSYAPVNRIKFANNDTITLMKLTWVFLGSDGTVDVTYNNPTVSGTAPSAPVTGDYWLDLNNSQWNRYSGSAWEVINRTILGISIQDATNCIAARSFDFYKAFSDINTIDLYLYSTEIIKMNKINQKISVNGSLFTFDNTFDLWNITNQLAGSSDMYDATEQASRFYFLYIKDNGDCIISDIKPYYEPFKLGWYHPHNPWRCVGSSYNNASSNLEEPNIYFNNWEFLGKKYDLTVTGTNWTTLRAVGICWRSGLYGNWRLMYNIYGTVSSGVGSLTLTISGIVFPSVGLQAVAAINSTAAYSCGYTNSGSGQIYLGCGANTIAWRTSGNIELNSKPTFVE